MILRLTGLHEIAQDGTRRLAANEINALLPPPVAEHPPVLLVIQSDNGLANAAIAALEENTRYTLELRKAEYPDPAQDLVEIVPFSGM